MTGYISGAETRLSEMDCKRKGEFGSVIYMVSFDTFSVLRLLDIIKLLLSYRSPTEMS